MKAFRGPLCFHLTRVGRGGEAGDRETRGLGNCLIAEWRGVGTWKHAVFALVVGHQDSHRPVQ